MYEMPFESYMRIYAAEGDTDDTMCELAILG
jgi:hypothetical protein